MGKGPQSFYINSKGPDQTAHPRSLIKAFAVVYRINIVENANNKEGWAVLSVFAYEISVIFSVFPSFVLHNTCTCQ